MKDLIGSVIGLVSHSDEVLMRIVSIKRVNPIGKEAEVLAKKNQKDNRDNEH